MSFRQNLDRAKALRRLLERATDRTPEDQPLDARKAQAATQLDDKLGPEWRREAASPGVVVVEATTLGAAPVPKAKVAESARSAHNDLLDRIRSALGDEQESGELLPEDLGNEEPFDREAKIEQLLTELKALLDCSPSDY